MNISCRALHGVAHTLWFRPRARLPGAERAPSRYSAPRARGATHLSGILPIPAGAAQDDDPRRVVTAVPALVVLAVGIDPTWALILSQVVLSFGIPFALVPLVVLTSRRSVMGAEANGRAVVAVAVVVTAAIVALNVALLVLTATG